MTTNNPQPTVQRMCEAFAKSDLDRLLETVHPHSRWTYVGVRIRGQQNAPTSAGKVLGSFSANHSKFDYHNIPGIRDRKRHPRRDRFESVIVTTTGHPFGNEWVQKYVVQDDLITEMEKYNIVGPRAALQPSLHPDQAAGCS